VKESEPLVAFANSTMSGCPTLALIAATTSAKGLEDVHAQAFDLDFSDGHIFFPQIRKT
jgi:hypothetical protein